jgi:hypothetical protein
VRLRQQAGTQPAPNAQPYEQTQTAPPPPPEASVGGGGLSSDEISQLKQLGVLHEDGVLTDAPFAAEMAKILHS